MGQRTMLNSTMGLQSEKSKLWKNSTGQMTWFLQQTND